MIFWRSEDLNSDVFKCNKFLLYQIVLLLVFFLRNLYITQGHKDFLLCILLEFLDFYLLHWHLWSIFCESLNGYGWMFIIFHMYIQLFQDHFLTNLYFLHWIAFFPLFLEKIRYHMHGSISGISISLHWSMSIFMAVSHCLDNCSSGIGQEIDYCFLTVCSTGFFFLWVGYSGSFVFLIVYFFSFSICTKKNRLLRFWSELLWYF